MFRESDIKKKAEDTLNSLESIQRATPGPFFYTRVQAAIQRSDRNTWNFLTSLLARPAVVISALLLIGLLNGLVLWEQTAPAAPVTEQNKQQFAEEYNIAFTTVYDYENPDAK